MSVHRGIGWVCVHGGHWMSVHKGIGCVHVH